MLLFTLEQHHAQTLMYSLKQGGFLLNLSFEHAVSILLAYVNRVKVLEYIMKNKEKTVMKEGT